jgi:hypothetical protein
MLVEAKVTEAIIIQSKQDPFKALAKALNAAVEDCECFVALDEPIYFIGDTKYSFPQSVLDWLLRFARWRYMEPLTFEVEYALEKEKSGTY